MPVEKTCLDIRPLVETFDLGNTVEPHPCKNVHVRDAVNPPARSGEPVTVLRETNLQDTVEPLRLVDVAC